MEIKTYADLAKIAEICHKKGIKELKIGQQGIEMTFGEKPSKARRSLNKLSEARDVIAQDPKPTEEDLMFWSSQIPGEVDG